jgi:hypothetical protein
MTMAKAVGLMLLSCVLTVCAVTTAHAQEFRGAIEGRVVDESGGTLPGVAVSAKHAQTNLGAVAVTNGEGLYHLPLLQPGFYTLVFELQGFKRAERSKVEVRVADQVVVNITLSVGQMTETVTVTAKMAVLELGNGSSGQVIDGKRLELMPMSDGNPFTLVRLTSGVVPFGDLRYFRPFDNNAVAEFAASGAPTSNAFSIDGAPNNTHRQGNADSRMAFTPPSAAVEEFKVQTSTFDASQGRAAGATINVAMKSGTNTLRGEAYHNYRDEKMADNDYFLKLRKQPEPKLDYIRPGFAVGGPLHLAKLYNGRSRTFFFTAFEWLKDKFPDASQRSVPSLKMRIGDFSELLPLGILIYDPATAKQEGSRIVRTPFSGNIIPPERISAIGREMIKYYPEPNQAGDQEGRINYISSVTRDDDYHTMNFRVDHNFNPSHRVFGRYSYNTRQEARGHWAGEVHGVAPVGFFMYRTNDALGLDYVWTRGSSVINVRGSWGRFQERDPRQSQFTFDPASFGFSPQTVALFRGYKYFPQIDLDRYDDLGATFNGKVVSNAWAFQPTWTKLVGKHSLRSGYDFRANREDELFDGHPAGLYQFRGNFTRQFDNSTNRLGQDVAALLLGQPTGGRIEQFGDRFNQVFYHGVFVQDDWRVTDKLTLNLGLRYEYETAPTERFNRNVRGFDPNAVLAVTNTVEARYAANPLPEIPASAFKARGGVQFVTDDDRGFWNPDVNNVQPRVGFAYQVNNKTVVRGGWAIYTQPSYVHGARQLGFTSSTPLSPTTDNGLTFRATLFNPFPDGMIAPVGQERGVNTNVGATLQRFYDDVNFVNGEAMRYVIGFQRELWWRFVLDASYVGTRGSDLRTDVQLNALPNIYLSTSPIRDQPRIDYLNGNSVPNPLAGLVPGTNLNGTSTQRQRLFRPYPQFESIEARRHDGSSKYDSLQLRLDRRFSNGVSFLTTYTHARATEKVSRLNEGDSDYEKRPSQSDIPHRIVVNPIWELPFGHGRAIASNAGRLLDALIGGWSIAGVWQYSSGEVLTWGNRYFAGDISQLRTRIRQGMDVSEPVFDTSGFYFHDAAVQTNGVDDPAKQRDDDRIDLERNLRTLPSRVGNFRGSPLNYLDISVVKRFRLAGTARAELRAEIYNATNYVWFRNPNLDPGAAEFGKVTSQGNLPREVQLGARIIF